MSKKLYPLGLLVILLFSTLFSFSQSPTIPAQGFQVFVEKGARFSSNESEGPIAIGEDLTIDGNYQVAIKSAGKFLVNKTPIGLLVNGKVIYKSGNALQVNNGYVKIGSADDSKVWYTDDNGAYSNIQICGGSYNSTPRIQIQKNAKELEVSESKNGVKDDKLIDFGQAMETMRKSSKVLGDKENNVTLTDANGNSVSSKKYPNQVKINLNKGANYLNISGNDLNSISVFTYNNKPDADHVLIINVDANDVFNWKVWNQAGIGKDECPYILYNFFNSETLKIEGDNTVEGTVFAPNCKIYKKNNSANIEGQIIGKSYEQDAGENHYANFDGDAEEKPCPKPTVAAITGSNTVCLGLNASLTNATSGGVWSSSANLYATVSNAGVVSGQATGNFIISYAVTNACGTTTVTFPMSTTNCGGVSSGSNGGLESKSLGNAVAQRMYQAATNSELMLKSYDQLPELKSATIKQKAAGITSQLNLLDLFPKQLSIDAIKAYITTPADIISITNAKAVASTDYTLNGSCKAVVFATLTQSANYDHTKAVCDRLKGATIQSIEKVNLMNFDLLRFNMNYEDGHVEQVISFSASTKSNRNSFVIQSNWLKTDYIPEDNMYNFQVWGVSNDIINEITQKILTQLSSIAPLEQSTSVHELPKTYFVGVSRDAKNISLNLHNSSSPINGRFEISDNANEKSTLITKKNIPFSIGNSADSKIQLPVSDIYESTVKMYINDTLIDEVFISDGTWDVDYAAANTVVKKFDVLNDPKREINDDYPINRNVVLEATTATYVSAFKLMRGGGMSQDLTGYKTFKFKASGNTTMNITLVKSSVKKWDDQYSLRIPISSDEKEYLIDLNDFISAGTKDKIVPDDINSIVFSMGTLSGTMGTINASLSNIAFTKETVSYIESLKSKSINVFPNPTSGKFNCLFKSDKAASSVLMITDAKTGKSVLAKSIAIVKGENVFPVDVSASFQNATGGTCIISIKSADATYTSQKIVILPN
ncbi:MAG: choice-of-anchor A family protein [Bacteroidetes bacterium]|nr:choice-of-anchor A family protein [Bacteroidota bacterium]